MSVIGIDLGTAYSRVAVYNRGLIEVVQDELHGRTVSSCVAFTPEERLIGKVAKQQMKKNPKNTIYGSKRLIGKSHQEVEELKSVELLPFDLENCEGKPKIRVQYRGQTKHLYPEEISAMVLSRLKVIASKKVQVSGAVITVPASFNIAQRKATCDAAHIAGINVLGLINETTAVALAYRLRDQKEFYARNALVLHMGVGTFDASVITIQESALKVRASLGNSHLGGENFTQCLFDKFRPEYEVNFKSNPTDACKLRIACEDLKSGLGDANQASLEVVINKSRKELTITRETFREQTLYYVRQIYLTIQQAMQDAEINKQQIDDVLITGGSAGMPLITEMIEKLGFEGKVRAMDIDEDAAYGAAAWAALISKKNDFRWKGFAIHDVISQSVFTNVSALPIFPGGSNIPQELNINWNWRKDSIRWSSNVGHIESMLINEERFMEENALKQRHRTVGKIVTLTTSNESTANFRLLIDGSGLPLITAAPSKTQMNLNLGLSIGEIKQSSLEAEIYRADDKKREEVMKALYDLERETDRLHSKCEKILLWCRGVSDPSREEIEKNRRALPDIRNNLKLTRKGDASTQTEDANNTTVEQARRETSATTLLTCQENNSQPGLLNIMKSALGLGAAGADSSPSSQRTVYELREAKEALEGALRMKDCQLRKANKKLEEMQAMYLKQEQLEASNAELMKERKLLQDETGNLQRNFAEAEEKIKELKKAERDSKKEKKKRSETTSLLPRRKKEDGATLKTTKEFKTELQKLTKENERLQKEMKKSKSLESDKHQLYQEIERLRKKIEELQSLQADRQQSGKKQNATRLSVESHRTPACGDYLKQRPAAWGYQGLSTLSKLCDGYIKSHYIFKPTYQEYNTSHEITSDQKLIINWAPSFYTTEFILRVSQKSRAYSGYARKKVKLVMDVERDVDYQYFLCAEDERGVELESRFHDVNSTRPCSSNMTRPKTQMSQL